MNLFTGVTGNVLPEDISHFISCGVNEVLTKPLTKERLINAIMKIQS